MSCFVLLDGHILVSSLSLRRNGEEVDLEDRELERKETTVFMVYCMREEPILNDKKEVKEYTQLFLMKLQ